MDPAILAAVSALTGSLIGGVSMLAASWLTQRGQFRAQVLVHDAVKREALYAEFIIEASKRITDAWSRQAESPEVIAGLYSAVERMRLTSSTEVIRVEWSEAYAVKGFGCRPGASDRPSIGAGVGKPPKNERAGSGERLAVYGDLAGQRLWRGMLFRRSLRAESR